LCFPLNRGISGLPLFLLKVPERKSVLTHLENPDFKDLLFTYVDVAEPGEKKAA
jgi:hypothetical protein